VCVSDELARDSGCCMHTMACVCNSDRGNAGGYFVVATSRLGLQLHVLRVCDLGDCE
jgi:hypothetical protein